MATQDESGIGYTKINRKVFFDAIGVAGPDPWSIDFVVLYRNDGVPFFVLWDDDDLTEPEPEDATNEAGLTRSQAVAATSHTKGFVSRVTVRDCGAGCGSTKKEVCVEDSGGNEHCKCKKCR